jgi:uncharacterized protein
MIPPSSEVPSPLLTEHSNYRVSSLSPRIASLDVIRGAGILGALFVSIWIFGGFTINQQNGLLLKSKGFDYRLFGTVDLLLTGKMKALVAIAFGAGMILFLSKENQPSQARADLFIRRQMWLLLLGLINALIFLWTGDMLFHFGIMGILLFPFIRLSQKQLLITAAFTLLIFCGKNYWNYSDDKKTYRKFLAVTEVEKKIKKDSSDNAKKDSILNLQKKDGLSKQASADTSIIKPTRDTLTKDQQEEKSAWENLVSDKKIDPKKDEKENKEMRKLSYANLWDHLLPNTQYKQAAWTYSLGIWDFATMILLGMFLLKFGFFNNRLSRSGYLLLAVGGIALGLLLGWFRLHNSQLTLQEYAKYIENHRLPHTIFFPLEIALTSIGYASLLIFIITTGSFTRLWRGLACVGNLALTNYLMQTIFCSIFFTGFGMGYFGRLSQTQLYLIAAEICLFQVVFSVLWLRRFHYGPAEWLLRSLVYKTWLPNRRQAPLASASAVTAE